MLKRGISVLLLLMLGSFIWAAGKTDEEDFQAVEGIGNWEHTIDVSELEPGKYNILVRARDSAGNESIGGPYNVFVDPDSDLPRLSISYPTPEQRVGERLFVVGTANDDDEVGYVEVRIDDGSFRRAEGGEYWSALLQMANLDDGPHTVTARAVDVYGTEGPEVSVVFNLDTTKPVSITDSHESGVLISRRTTISGSVEDANGVASLLLVTADGETELRLRGGRDAAPRFDFEIDPREMEEGPTVWWLRSTDLTGSVGVTPFVFFVDSSPPELSIIYPTEEDRVDEQLRVIGRVFDTVGIESLTYELSTGETGEIPLAAGNPFWMLSADLGPSAKGNVTATFTVLDVAGNEQSVRERFELDTDGDQPVVVLERPTEGSIVERAVLSGIVRDDDAVAAVLVTVDGAEAQRVTAEGGFLVDLDLPPGQHDIRIAAEDARGVIGEEIRRRFTVAGSVPAISLTTVTVGESASDYRPGFVLQDGERGTLSGTVSGDAPPARVDYRIGATVGKANVGEGGAFSVPLPRAEAGAYGIDIWYLSPSGVAARTIGLYVQLPEAEEGSSAPEIDDVLSNGLHATADPAAPVSLEDGRATTDLPVLLARGSSLYFRAVGGRPSDASIDPEVDFLSVTTQGDYVVVRASGEGAVDGLVVSASVGSSTRRSSRLNLVTEMTSPVVRVAPGDVGAFVNDTFTPSVTISDPVGVARVRARLVAPGTEDGRWSEADLSEEGDYAISLSLPAQDGAYFAEIEATDASGRMTLVRSPVNVDRSAPSLIAVVPRSEDIVNGTISIIGRVPDSDVKRVTVVGETPTQLQPDTVVAYEFVATSESSSITFETEDTAGNVDQVTVTVNADDSADQPILQVQVPEENGVFRQEFRLSGVLLDDDEAVRIEYRVDEGDLQSVPTDGIFDVTLPMTNLVDGEHMIEVIGYDNGDTPSEPVVRSFAISRTEPESTVIAPTIDEYLRGIIEISGTAEDPNGIDAVYVSTDNGASYQRATGTTEWAYLLDSRLLDDGTHSVIVKAVDGAQTEGLLTTTINTDNTSPVLELTEPADGVTVSGTFIIDGRGEDDALSIVRLMAQGLERGEPAIELISFDTSGPFAYSVDSAGLSAGWYNLRVEAEDRAGNTRRISRNLLVEPPQQVAAPQIVSPAAGMTLAHKFWVSVAVAPGTGPVTLLANETPVSIIEVDEGGRGRLLIEPGTIPEGDVALQLRSEADENGEQLVGAVNVISYTANGPWVTVDDPPVSAFVRDRPYLTGQAGYAVDLPEGEDRETQRAIQEILDAHAVEQVEVSLDNGRTFDNARGGEEWQYRIETTALPDGQLNMLIRVTFADGSASVVRHYVVVDEQPPAVRLLAPQERDSFDESIRIVGVTTDENELSDVAVVLREGDKSRYQVPSFIQGLYLDVHAMGATIFDVGAGLTFFDDNVRLQAQVGTSPAGRFSGLVIGAKLLANVFTFPFSFVFGPDFEWLSAAIAVGANFSYFTMSEDEIAFTDEGLVIAGMVAQLELPIVTFEGLSMFNTLSFYTEGQLWFISSDVEAGIVPRISFGLRANVF
jgi:hypothetical protein